VRGIRDVEGEVREMVRERAYGSVELEEIPTSPREGMGKGVLDEMGGAVDRTGGMGLCFLMIRQRRRLPDGRSRLYALDGVMRPRKGG
jgi:hypothetical protein